MHPQVCFEVVSALSCNGPYLNNYLSLSWNKEIAAAPASCHKKVSCNFMTEFYIVRIKIQVFISICGKYNCVPLCTNTYNDRAPSHTLYHVLCETIIFFIDLLAVHIFFTMKILMTKNVIIRFSQTGGKPMRTISFGLRLLQLMVHLNWIYVDKL